MTVVGLLGLLFSRCTSGADSVVGARPAGPAGPVARAVASVVVFLAADVLVIGDTTSTRVEVRDEAHQVVQSTSVSWTSADSATAAVSSQGIVSAMGYGITDITATVDGVSGSARVFVLDTTTITGSAVEPELPRDSVDVAWRAATGNTITVRRGDDLQRALETARRGDQVVIEVGAEFRGHFVLPSKAGTASDGWITVLTSAIDQLPAAGTRIDPAQHAALMPKLITPDHGPALATEAGASGWRVVGIEVTVDTAFSRIQQGLVLLGDGSRAQGTPESVPTDIILDRVYVHGAPLVNLKRCVALNSARTAIVSSQLLECHGKGFDSQAIGGWNGPGPYLIENNRLEAAGEVIIFGGADPGIAGLITSDITIRRNILTRPMAWKGVWTVKNLFELKNAQRVLVEANILENHWVDAQAGSAVVLGSANQSNGPCTWCIVSDVTFRWNHVNNVSAVFNIFARQTNAQPTRRIAVRQNLFTNVGVGVTGSVARIFMLGDDVHDLSIENNTGTAPYSYVTLGGTGAKAKQRFTFRNNLGGGAQYNWFSSQGQGDKANIATLARGYLVTNNGFVGGRGSIPSGSKTAASLTEAGLVNPVWPDGDWSLGAGSPFAGMGVDWTTLQTKLIGVR